MENIPSFLTFPISPLGDRISVSSVEELLVWLDDEHEAWKWLEGTQAKHPQISEIVGNQTTRIAKSKRQIENFEGKGEKEKQEALVRVEQLLTAHFVEQRAVCRLSTIYELILKYKESNELLAAYIAGSHQKDLPSSNEPIALKGFIEYQMFNIGYPERLPAEITGFEKLRASYQSMLNELNKNIGLSDDLLEGFESKSKIVLDEQGKSLKDAIKEYEEGFNNSLIQSKSELLEITKTYDSKLALQASISYWKKRTETLKSSATKFTLLAIIATVVIAVLVLVLPMAFLSIGGQAGFTWSGALPEVHWLANDHELYNWQISIFIILLFFAVWLIRIIVRLLLTNLHLETDANERVTMINTYLAMLREGNGIEAKEKKLILESLFRHTPTGLIKDEATPPSYLSLLSRLR